MRRALGLIGKRNGQGVQPRPEQLSKPLAHPSNRAPGDRSRQRFVQDGDVPVTLVGRPRPSEADMPVASESRNAIEAVLQDERAARASAERGLQDALATIRDLQTKLGHAELAHREALEAARSARDAAEALRAEQLERGAGWREDFAAGRAVAEAALHEAVLARARVEPGLQAASATGPASNSQKALAKPTAKVSAKGASKAAAIPGQREPRPVKWWLKAANR